MPDSYMISITQVEKRLRAIKTTEASNPDDFPNWVSRVFADSLNEPVSISSLFNNRLCQGHVPQVWESANVGPLAKDPSPSMLEKHINSEAAW